MKAIIYQPTRSTMQAGLKHTKSWVLESQDREKKIDPLMGWTSSKDTDQQVHIKFNTKDEAISFAKKNNIDYELKEAKAKTIKPNPYANNFT